MSISKYIEISSSTNSQFKIFKSLLTSKGIKENKMFFLMGEKLIQEFLESKNSKFKAEYLISNEPVQLKTEAKKTILSKDLFKELDILGTHSSLLILSFESFAQKNMNLNPKGLELICPLGDPRNLGALVRSALGFDVQEIILTQEAAHPFLPHSIKASAGAVLKINFTLAGEVISKLPLIAENFALELHGTAIEKIKWPRDLRLWVGEEGPGLQLSPEQKKFMKFVNIPTDNIESLNAMVSTSLAIWEWKKQTSKLY